MGGAIKVDQCITRAALYKYFALGILFVIVIGGFPRIALAVDLMRVYHDALDHDATYAASKASYKANLEKLPEGRAGLLPNLSISAHSAWNQFSSKTGAFQGYYDSGGYTIQLVQHIFNIPLWEEFKEGEIQTKQSEVQLTADTQSLMVRVSQAYFDVIAAEEVLEAQRSLKKASQEQLDVAKNSYRVGTKPSTDVDEAQSRFDLATAQVFAAKNDLEVKKSALFQISGVEPGELARLRDGAALVLPQPEDVDQWVQSAESDNPSVIVKQLAYEVARHEVTRIYSGHMPTVDFLASRQNVDDVNTLNGAYTTTDQKTLMLEFNLPLYAGGGVSARAREAYALKEKAREDWIDTKRTVGQAARQNYLGVMSGISQAKALESAVASSAASLKENKVAYKVGVRTNIDVLNAQSQLADAHQRLIKARFDTLLAQLKLKAATGQLAESDLREVNSLLEE